MALYSCLEHKSNSHRIQFHLNPHKEIWTIEANLVLMENRSLPLPLTVFVFVLFSPRTSHFLFVFLLGVLSTLLLL